MEGVMAGMTHVLKTDVKFWKHARSNGAGNRRTPVGNNNGLM